MTTIESAAIVGAGQMGRGIAEVCTTSGIETWLCDVSQAALDDAVNIIETNLIKQVERGRMSNEALASALSRIRCSTRLEDLSEVDLAIEAATEKRSIKEDIFVQLDKTLNENAIFATNTSSISITGLAALTQRPHKFIGVHFMNPVPRMRLIEVIRALTTDQPTYDCVTNFAERLGKKIVNSEDYPAFIVNRVLIPMINEAVYALYEGVGSVAAIDQAMKLGANHPMGPLELADFIGLDTCLAIMQVLHDGLADTKYRPCPLLVKYVEADWCGRKTGRGFYDYQTSPPSPTR